MSAPIHIHIDLGNVGKLSEPLSKLVDVIAKGTGLGPLGTVLQARADAHAKIIETKADVEAQGIVERALRRAEHREAVRQHNLERIIALAAEELPASVSPDPVDQDWTFQFFDHAQDVCDEQMQTLWVRILLSGEVASPGNYSKRTLQFLKTMERSDALKFTELCSFAFADATGWHYIIEHEYAATAMLEKMGPGDFVNHFTSIGLLSPNHQTPKVSSLNGKKIKYFGSEYILKGPIETRNKFELFLLFRPFSQTGQELAKISGGEPSHNFLDGLSKKLDTEYRVTIQKI